jgi:hypothetical protein
MMKTFLPTSLVLVSVVVAHAESLEEKKFWKLQTERIDRSLAETEKVCGFKPTFEFLDKEKLREHSEKTKSSPYGICDNIVLLVNTICREGEDEKAAVREKISGFQCGFATPRTLQLDKKIVKYGGNNAEYNFTDWAKPLLLKKL